MLRFGGRLLSLILRARQGTCLRDAEIYSWRWVSEEDSAAIAGNLLRCFDTLDSHLGYFRIGASQPIRCSKLAQARR